MGKVPLEKWEDTVDGRNPFRTTQETPEDWLACNSQQTVVYHCFKVVQDFVRP